MSIAAMKQALEVMGLIGADSICEAAHHQKKNRHEFGEPCPIQQRWHKAFDTLRAAIEQANEFNPDWDAMAVMVEEQQRMAKRIEELEAQQKPWVKTYAGGQPHYTMPEEPGVKLDASAPLVVHPHPAFKKWKGLTDEEIAEVRHLYDGTAGWTIERFARQIEAKLKEKNT